MVDDRNGRSGDRRSRGGRDGSWSGPGRARPVQPRGQQGKAPADGERRPQNRPDDGPPIPADVQPKGVALPSFVTASSEFYRVDTALSVPQLSHGAWRLRIHGMVDREVTYSFGDLAEFEVVEMATTLTCVSNPVGGPLISTGIWTGYRVADLLAGAHVHADRGEKR